MAAVVEVVVKVAEVVMVVIGMKRDVTAKNSICAILLCTSVKALAAMVVREAVEPRAGMVAMAVLPYQAPVW